MPEIDEAEKAIGEATAYGNSIADAENEKAIAEMKRSGRTVFYEPTSQEQAAWRNALEPLAEEMSKRLGRQLIEEFRKEARAATH